MHLEMKMAELENSSSMQNYDFFYPILTGFRKHFQVIMYASESIFTIFHGFYLLAAAILKKPILSLFKVKIQLASHQSS